MDYTELLGRLAEATDDELATARDAILARLEELRPIVESGNVDDPTLDELESLVDAHQQIGAQVTERETAASGRSERAAAALRLVAPEVEETPEEAPEEEPVAEAEPVETPEPVAAAARPPLGAVSAASQQGPMPRRQEQPVAVTAAADVQGFAAGQNLESRDQLAEAFARRLHSLRRVSGGNGEQVQVATFRAPDAPAARRLKKDDPHGNFGKMRDQEPAALVAAGGNGGLCAPFTPDYSVGVVGTLGRPVRDALSGFQADRGGIQYRKDFAGAAFGTGAFGVWTNDMDALVGDDTDPPAAKPHAVLACPAVVEAEVEAQTFQLEISNVTARFDPEATRAEIDAAHIAFDRWSENRLLAKLKALSTVIQQATALGATRDLLALLDKLIAYYRSYYRLTDLDQMRLIAPQWMQNLLRTDLERAMQTSNMDYFSVPESKFTSWLSDRGVNVTYHLDGTVADVAASGGAPAFKRQQYAGPLAANAAVPGFPDTTDMLLFQEGKMINLDGGTLDIGIVRDSGLVNNNRYRMFMEEWSNPIHKGVEAFYIVAALQPSGASVGTVPPSVTATPATD